MKATLLTYMNTWEMFFWKKIKRLMSKNYYTAKASYKYQLYRSSKQHKKPPLIIYQMGKVGSSTVQNSLEACKLDMPIYKVHGLTDDYITPREERTKKYYYIEMSRDIHHFNIKAPWICRYLQKQINKGLNGKKWKIVTLVRDPIGRNVSVFFHHFKDVELQGSEYRYKINSERYNFELTVNLEDNKTITKLFLEKVEHNEPLEFFDNELKSVFGIDVFASEFPKSKGYKIYNEEKADVLLIKLENLKECAREAFKEFLGIEGFTLINKNVGGEKNYSDLYKIFKESVNLPETYIDKMYKSKFMRHFYSEEEIEKFKIKWHWSAVKAIQDTM